VELEEFKGISTSLIERSKAAFLTTIDSDGFPITRAMFNLRNKEQFPEFVEFYREQENIFTIYISTNTSSSKVSHIRNNPKISVYYCDPDEFKGLMFGGEVIIVDDKNLKYKIWLDWWDKYYLEGIDDPDYTLLQLNPKQARYYYKLKQDIFEL
jgi:general stress protein 26